MNIPIAVVESSIFSLELSRFMMIENFPMHSSFECRIDV